MNLFKLHTNPEQLALWNVPYAIETTEGVKFYLDGERIYTSDEYAEAVKNSSSGKAMLKFLVMLDNFPRDYGDDEADQLVDFINDNQIGNNPAVEKKILNLGNNGARLMAAYAFNVIGGRWEEAEEYIETDDEVWDYYAEDYIE